jgi:hypothetical protein
MKSLLTVMLSGADMQAISALTANRCKGLGSVRKDQAQFLALEFRSVLKETVRAAVEPGTNA